MRTNRVPLYPHPWESGVGFLTFYGTIRDAGILKGIDEDLGITSFVRLGIDVGMPQPSGFRMIRDFYWDWYWSHVGNRSHAIHAR